MMFVFVPIDAILEISGDVGVFNLEWDSASLLGYPGW